MSRHRTTSRRIGELEASRSLAAQLTVVHRVHFAAEEIPEIGAQAGDLVSQEVITLGPGDKVTRHKPDDPTYLRVVAQAAARQAIGTDEHATTSTDATSARVRKRASTVPIPPSTTTE